MSEFSALASATQYTAELAARGVLSSHPLDMLHSVRARCSIPMVLTYSSRHQV